MNFLVIDGNSILNRAFYGILTPSARFCRAFGCLALLFSEC